MTKSPQHSALSYVLYLLAKRDYAEAELRRKLSQKEYADEEIEQAIAKALEHNWLNEARFCAGFIRYRAQQGYGPRRLYQELQQKGVESWLIEQILDECEVDWFELAERVFHKKRPIVWDFKAKGKMWRYMISRGFENDHFNYLLDEDWGEEDE